MATRRVKATAPPGLYDPISSFALKVRQSQRSPRTETSCVSGRCALQARPEPPGRKR